MAFTNRKRKQAAIAYLRDTVERERRWQSYIRDGLTPREVVTLEAAQLGCVDLLPESWRRA